LTYERSFDNLMGRKILGSVCGSNPRYCACGSTHQEKFGYPLHATGDIGGHLEIPDSNDGPAGSCKAGIDNPVSSDVPANLLLPIRAGGRANKGRVTMPIGPVDKHGYFRSLKRNVRPTGKIAEMKAIASDLCSPQRPAQLKLGDGVLAMDRSHDFRSICLLYGGHVAESTAVGFRRLS
jgi:hypothetical protein